MVIDQARQRIDDLDRPQQIAVMLGAVCHDLGKPPTTAFLDGRIRSIDHEQAGVAPATRCSTGSTSISSEASTCAARCSASSPTTSSRGCSSSRDAGRRRCVPPAGAEGGPRAAGPRGECQTAWDARAISTAPASTGFSSARGSSASSTRRRSPRQGTAPAGPRAFSQGPGMGEVLRADLRATARRVRHDSRRRTCRREDARRPVRRQTACCVPPPRGDCSTIINTHEQRHTCFPQSPLPCARDGPPRFDGISRDGVRAGGAGWATGQGADRTFRG